MNNLCGKEFLTGPFDECIACPSLRNGCSGPRTSAMEYPGSWCVWTVAVMERFGIKKRHIADGTPLSYSTVDDIISGRRKDMTRSACCYIENFVLGDGKWPCAMHLAEGKDVVYQDRTETLEALRVKDEKLQELEEAVRAAKNAHAAEAEEYKQLVQHLYIQIDRKDNYIDRLAKKAGF